MKSDASSAVASPPEKAAVQNPHDLFFKQAFRHQDVAAGEMIRILSPELLRHLDLGRIALDETSLLDAQFKGLFSDRLFRVPLKNDGDVFIWLLIEHQSRNHRLMPLRLLEYAASRWRGYRLLHKDVERIPLLIPIVLQHDPQGWTAPRSFADLYDAPPALLYDVGRYAIDFSYLLDDLQAETEAEIAARCPSVALAAVLMALKHGGAIAVTEASKWNDLFTQLDAEENIELVYDLLWYFFQRGSQAMIHKLEQENPIVQHAAETILDRKFNEGHRKGEAKGRKEGEARGRREGEAKGRREGVRQTLCTVLTAKSGFHITDEVETKLQAASVVQMDEWTRRLVLGEAPQDVLGIEDA